MALATIGRNQTQMKRPLNIGQAVGIISGVLIPILLWLNTLSNRVSEYGVQIENMKTQQYSNQVSTDAKLDRINEKLDKIVTAQADQRLLIENKQNRK